MQKVVNFLEQYVEWLALGLGVLFFGWVFWTNVITPPAAATVGGQMLTAADVDQKVYETSAQALDSKIHSGGSLSVVVPDARAEINAKLNPTPAEPLASTLFTSKIFTPQNPSGDLPGMPKKQNPQPNSPQIAELPVPPAATPYGVIGGLSTLDLPAAPGAQPNPQQSSTDQIWASASFTVPLTDIANEFQAKHIQQTMSRTSFLQVELVRQEQLPGGAWGEEKVIPAAPQTAVVQPFPPVGNKGLEIPYRQWADTAQMLIIQPPFYTIKAGTPWEVPGTPVINPNAKPFDPAHDIAKTDAEKELKKKYDHEQFLKREAERANHAKSAGRSSGSRGGRGGAAGGQPANAPRPVYNQARPNYRGGSGASSGDDAAGVDGTDTGAGTSAVAQPQGLPPEVQKMLGPVGTAPFDPGVLAKTTDKLLIWAHDLTVEPGKTYRYKVHYKLANPLYMAKDGFAPQKLTDQFALVSKDSAWTDSIRIPATVEFFIHQGIASSLNAAVFDLYRWHNGQLCTKTATVQVGDIIGGPDGDIDYTTGWTVVDVRSDARSSYAVLMDAKGNIVRRDFPTDIADPRNRELKAQVATPLGPNGQPLATSGGAAGTAR